MLSLSCCFAPFLRLSVSRSNTRQPVAIYFPLPFSNLKLVKRGSVFERVLTKLGLFRVSSDSTKNDVVDRFDTLHEALGDVISRAHSILLIVEP
jgi:hypothetical protein